MTHLIMGLTLGQTRTQGQNGLAALQGLSLALLIDRIRENSCHSKEIRAIPKLECWSSLRVRAREAADPHFLDPSALLSYNSAADAPFERH